MSSTQYRITKPLKDLPPAEPLVIPINGAFELNVPQKLQAIIIDFVIKNRDALDASLTLNDQPAFTVDAGDTLSEDNVGIYYIAVSGITQGVILAHTLDLRLLQRHGAIEIA